VQRHLARGDARLLSMTLTERSGRLYLAVCYALRDRCLRAGRASAANGRPPAQPASRAGVDLGLRVLATVTATDGITVEFPNPMPLRATLAERRRTGRQLSRRIPGSRGHRSAKATLARLDRRAASLRRETAHQLTTWLAATHGEIVIEDLDIAAMKKSMGRRAFRRAVGDAALGPIRPMLTYKTQRTGTVLTIADRWFSSSQVHHGCGCRLVGLKSRLDKKLPCAVTGELIDRDRNAALNLRDYQTLRDRQEYRNSRRGLVETTDPDASSSEGGGAGPDAHAPGEAA
jgi:putative transposase